MPPVERSETLPATLALDAQTVHAQVQLEPVRKFEVYILMHSHNDIGYTDIQPHIAAKQAHNVLRALELIQKTKDYPEGARFKWNLEVLIPYENFHAIATPEQERQFAAAVRKGSIGIDAMYANLLTGVCRSEELLRQFSFATALGRRYGVKVDSMMISDVPGLTWGVVPALVQNGARYISDGPNANPGAWRATASATPGAVGISAFLLAVAVRAGQGAVLGGAGRLFDRPWLRVDHDGLAVPLPSPCRGQVSL